RAQARRGGIHLVVEPRPGAGQQRGLADRLPAGDAVAARPAGGVFGAARAALFRPRALHRGLPRVSQPPAQAVAPAGSRWSRALATYGKARIASMFALGFSAGLPFLLVFSTLTAWLTEAGVT